MMDVLFLGIMAASFATLIVFVFACERL